MVTRKEEMVTTRMKAVRDVLKDGHLNFWMAFRWIAYEPSSADLRAKKFNRQKFRIPLSYLILSKPTYKTTLPNEVPGAFRYIRLTFSTMIAVDLYP